MKNIWLWVVIILVVLGGGYYYKHQIKLMLTGGYSAPASMSYGTTGTSPSTAATGAALTWMGTSPSQYGVGSNGLTLYTFDKDTKNVSNCSGSCAGLWPAYTSATTPSSLPANVTTFKTAGGLMQFAYMGKPLYYYSGDKAAGDMNGDGVGGVWHVLKP